MIANVVRALTADKEIVIGALELALAFHLRVVPRVLLILPLGDELLVQSNSSVAFLISQSITARAAAALRDDDLSGVSE